MSDLVKPSTTEAAMRKAAMSLPPSDFGSHRAIQAAARAADDLIAPYRARIAALEGDADMVDEREMRSNLRIEALEAERDTELGEHARAQVENEQLVRSLRKRIEAVEAALRDYHFMLDSRKNGDVAADNLRQRIEEILGMPWEQGVEMKRRAAEKGDGDE